MATEKKFPKFKYNPNLRKSIYQKLGHPGTSVATTATCVCYTLELGRFDMAEHFGRNGLPQYKA